MRKWLGALSVAVLVASVALVAQAQNFKVINKTGFTIMALYASEADNTDWEDDILGREVLANGESTEIKFSGYDDDVCKFDIRIDDEDENQYIIEDIDLCKLHVLTFKKQGKDVVYEGK